VTRFVWSARRNRQAIRSEVVMKDLLRKCPRGRIPPESPIRAAGRGVRGGGAPMARFARLESTALRPDHRHGPVIDLAARARPPAWPPAQASGNAPAADAGRSADGLAASPQHRPFLMAPGLTAGPHGSRLDDSMGIAKGKGTPTFRSACHQSCIHWHREGKGIQKGRGPSLAMHLLASRGKEPSGTAS
jgi:hypothetical protein